MIEFKEFKKIPRLSHDCIITEKIDGTNGVIGIEDTGKVWAGNRSRWLFNTEEGMLSGDNFGFASWVKEHIGELLYLGPGVHYGEWWGSGIQRGYNLPKGERRFSLFNTEKWGDNLVRPKCCNVVVKLYDGLFCEDAWTSCIGRLKDNGSYTSPGFMQPEGIVIYHKAGNIMFKKTIKDDDKPKGQK